MKWEDHENVKAYREAYRELNGEYPDLRFKGGGWFYVGDSLTARRTTQLRELTKNMRERKHMLDNPPPPPPFKRQVYLPGNVYQFVLGGKKGAFRIKTIKIDPNPNTTVLVMLAGVSPNPVAEMACGQFCFTVGEFELAVNSLEEIKQIRVPTYDRCMFVKDHSGNCGEPAAIPDVALCVEHIGLKCAACDKQATHNMAWCSLEAARKHGEHFCEEHWHSHRIPTRKDN